MKQRKHGNSRAGTKAEINHTKKKKKKNGGRERIPLGGGGGRVSVKRGSQAISRKKKEYSPAQGPDYSTSKLGQKKSRNGKHEGGGKRILVPRGCKNSCCLHFKKKTVSQKFGHKDTTSRGGPL